MLNYYKKNKNKKQDNNYFGKNNFNDIINEDNNDNDNNNKNNDNNNFIDDYDDSINNHIFGPPKDFKELDLDNNKLLNKYEIMNGFNLTGMQAEQFIQQYDLNRDGYLDENEYNQFLQQQNF